MEEFKSYIPKPKFCLGWDKIIDLGCQSLFRQGFPAVDKEIVDYVQAHFGIDAISEVDSEYHHSKKTYPHIRHMSELRFTQDLNVDKVKLPRKADGIVRLQNYDSDGLEAMLLEVSGPPSAKDLSKHAEDFFKLVQEMQDSFNHAIFKAQSAQRSSQILQERLCIYSIQCWGLEMEISIYFVLFRQQWIVPLYKLKIPSVLKDINQLKNIEIAMVSIKAFLLKIVNLLEEMEEGPETFSPRQNSTQIHQTPVKQLKKKKMKMSPGSK
ncbi:hypothetical protein HDU77_007788 [Chytriomyces hyalinus]|nr:hypothetical protein HDU77_007788 [Chytriomyces hyalinus]